MGAPALQSTTQRGSAYIVFGGTNTSSFSLSNLNNRGIVIHGEAVGDELGYSVSQVGDMNGDGLSDLIVSSSDFNSNAGRSYVIFGSTDVYKTKFATGNMGTSGRDTLGSNTNTIGQTLVGGAGDDTLTAGSAADVLYGGVGNDVFVLNGSYIANLYKGFDASTGRLAKVGGGDGIDTIQLIGGAVIDFSKIKNVAYGQPSISSQISSIEKIDLGSDTAANSAVIGAKDIQDMAGMNWINSGASGWTSGSYILGSVEQFHQLVVNGGGMIL